MFAMRIEWTGDLHRRYVINDNGRYWTGSGWSEKLRDGRLYLTHQHCAREYQVLAQRWFANKPVREFQVMLQVQVYADSDYSLHDLQRYLSDASTFVILTEKGHGPVDGSLAVVTIPWSDLRETTRD